MKTKHLSSFLTQLVSCSSAEIYLTCSSAQRGTGCWCVGVVQPIMSDWTLHSRKPVSLTLRSPQRFLLTSIPVDCCSVSRRQPWDEATVVFFSVTFKVKIGTWTESGRPAGHKPNTCLTPCSQLINNQQLYSSVFRFFVLHTLSSFLHFSASVTIYSLF